MEFLTKDQIQIINEPVPAELIDYIDGNKYVSAMFIVDKLNKIFNYAWSFTIIDSGMHETYNNKDEFKKNGYIVWVKGRLSVPMHDFQTNTTVWIHKESIGGKILVGPAKVQAQAYKSAASDCLKKCASMLGLANNVYMKDEIYELLSEEDVWTEKKIATYGVEIAKFTKLQETLGNEKVSQKVKEYCDSTQDYTSYGEITPSNIENFLNYIFSELGKEEAESNAKNANVESTNAEKAKSLPAKLF